MNLKNKCYQFVILHNFPLTELIQIHIEKYPFKENTVITFVDDKIIVSTKQSSGIYYRLTITKDGHAGAELIPSKMG